MLCWWICERSFHILIKTIKNSTNHVVLRHLYSAGGTKCKIYPTEEWSFMSDIQMSEYDSLVNCFCDACNHVVPLS